MTDVLLEVSILEQLPPGEPLRSRRVLAGPFFVRGTAVLQPGYTINYEMLLHNLSSDCSCVPKVRRDIGPSPAPLIRDESGVTVSALGPPDHPS